MKLAIRLFLIISISITINTLLLSKKKKPRKLKQTIKKPKVKQRVLYDDVYNIHKEDYANQAKMSDKERKLQFLNIIHTILNKARKRKRKIKKVIIGTNLKSTFNNENLMKDMIKYLNDDHLDKRIRKLKQSIKKDKLKQKQRQILKQMKEAERMNRVLRKKLKEAQSKKIKRKKPARSLPLKKGMVPTGAMGAMGKPPTDPSTMKFNYLPGFGGPFGGMPPMMMGSVNMHPPVNVTVNRIPNPNPNAKLNPLEIQKANLQSQNKELKDVQSKLGVLDNMLDGIDQDISLNLNDKETKIMQLNN